MNSFLAAMTVRQKVITGTANNSELYLVAVISEAHWSRQSLDWMPVLAFVSQFTKRYIQTFKCTRPFMNNLKWLQKFFHRTDTRGITYARRYLSGNKFLETIFFPKLYVLVQQLHPATWRNVRRSLQINGYTRKFKYSYSRRCHHFMFTCLTLLFVWRRE